MSNKLFCVIKYLFSIDKYVLLVMIFALNVLLMQFGDPDRCGPPAGHVPHIHFRLCCSHVFCSNTAIFGIIFSF